MGRNKDCLNNLVAFSWYLYAVNIYLLLSSRFDRPFLYDFALKTSSSTLKSIKNYCELLKLG